MFRKMPMKWCYGNVSMHTFACEALKKQVKCDEERKT